MPTDNMNLQLNRNMKKQQKLPSESIILDKLGHNIKIPVRYSSRAKRISIRVNHNGAELILPNKHYNAGYRFLLSKERFFSQNYL